MIKANDLSDAQKQTPGSVGIDGRANADTNAESALIVGGQPVNRKLLDTYRAAFACAGHELYVVHKRDAKSYFEVRRWGQAKTCSTFHDLQAFYTQVTGGAA